MVVAIASKGNTLQSDVDPNFGRCTWFCIYDAQSEQPLFIANVHKDDAENAGEQAVNLLKQYGANAVVAGRFGKKAVERLKMEGIQMVVSPEGQTVAGIIGRTKR